MRTLTTLASIFALTFSFACGSEDEKTIETGDKNDIAEKPEPKPEPKPDSDPDPIPSASNLGKACGQGIPCETATDRCIVLVDNGPGFCSNPCSEATPETCTASNGFSGPGAGRCLLPEVKGGPVALCVVLCGPANNGDTSCPAGLTCLPFPVEPGGTPGEPAVCLPE